MDEACSADRGAAYHGAHLDLADAKGKTAAAYAIAGGNLDSLPRLLEPKTSPELLAQAYETKDWRFIEPILTRQTESLPWTTAARGYLMEAVEASDRAKTQLLLSKYEGAPTPEGQPQPLLAWMLRDNQIDQFKFLLECGADPDTPINSPATKAFNQVIAQEPLRSYLNSEPGMTTLMLAAGLSRPEFVRALLAKGAKRGLVSGRYKLPALTFAAETNTPACLQMLIGDSPSPEQMRIEISLASQRATVFAMASRFFHAGFHRPSRLRYAERRLRHHR